MSMEARMSWSNVSQEYSFCAYAVLGKIALYDGKLYLWQRELSDNLLFLGEGEELQNMLSPSKLMQDMEFTQHVIKFFQQQISWMSTEHFHDQNNIEITISMQLWHSYIYQVRKISIDI